MIRRPSFEPGLGSVVKEAGAKQFCRSFFLSRGRSQQKAALEVTTFEVLNNDIVCLILDKTLKPSPPGINSRTLASFACVSSRYASLVKERAWERACRNALPDLCKILLNGDKESPGNAGWDCFAKLLTRCPGYRSKMVNLVMVMNHIPPNADFLQILFQGSTGQTRGLETFNIALESHVSDSWSPAVPFETTAEEFLSEAGSILPGLVRDKSPFFLLSNCERESSHVVHSTYTKWVTQNAAWNVWEAVPDAHGGHSTQAIVRVYRGMVADVSALASDCAHKPGR